MKKLAMILAALLCCVLVTACGETTMDNGKDTDGHAGEPAGTATSSPMPSPSVSAGMEDENGINSGANGEGAADAARNVGEGAGDLVDGAVDAGEDVVDGAANAGKDIVDGAKDAVDDAGNAVKNAVE